MKTQPYEKSSIRRKRNWAEAAQIMGTHPVILFEAYLDSAHAIRAKDFFDSIKTNDEPKFLDKIRERIKEISYSTEELETKQKETDEFDKEWDFPDEVNYRLKTLVEIGDEVLAQETKSYTFSQIQYITKGKRYKILSLKDETGSEFSFTTTTDLPDEINYGSVYGIKSLWRDGKEIWNWQEAYLNLWLEQNPDNPQNPELIEHCKKDAEKLRNP